MHSPRSCFLPDEAATLAAGKSLAALTSRGALISLSGDLGAGKTTFCRGLIRACGHQGAVKSPTYTLVEPYELEGRQIMHFDLYRLADPEELEFIGFRDYLQAPTLCLIEWPEKAGALLPGVDLRLELRLEGTGRRLSWEAGSAAGEEIARAFSQSLPA